MISNTNYWRASSLNKKVNAAGADNHRHRRREGFVLDWDGKWVFSDLFSLEILKNSKWSYFCNALEFGLDYNSYNKIIMPCQPENFCYFIVYINLNWGDSLVSSLQ